MLTGYERAKVRKATLTFPVLLLLRFLMRGWAGNQFSSATDRHFAILRQRSAKKMRRYFTADQGKYEQITEQQNGWAARSKI